MRDRTTISNRMHDLEKVIQWNREHKFLTIGQIIMVNQERASLFRELEEPTTFTQSVIVQQKINKVLNLIAKTNWQPKN